MIGDVGRKIRGLSVLANHHPIFVVAEGRCLEPEGPFLAVYKPFLLQFSQEPANAIVPVKVSFAEVGIKFHAECLQILLDALQNRPGGIIRKRRNDCILPFRQPGVAVCSDNPDRQIFHIVAAVAAFGKFHRLPHLFPIAIPEGPAEVVHLVAGVVDVVFPGNGISRRRHQIGKDVPHHGAAGVADMQRARRIGADKFHLHLLAPAKIHPAVSIPLRMHGRQPSRPGLCPDEEIHEAGAGNFNPIQDPLRILNGLRQGIGKQSGILFLPGSQNHGEIRGVIAVRRVFRHLHFDARHIVCYQQTLLVAGGQGPPEYVSNPVFHR
jgi:hypothetical protein